MKINKNKDVVKKYLLFIQMMENIKTNKKYLNENDIQKIKEIDKQVTEICEKILNGIIKDSQQN